MLENMLKDICGADLFASIYETLSINLFSPDGKYAMILDAVQTLYNVIMPIGVMVMFVYFLVNLEKSCTDESFTWEKLWYQFAMLLAAKFIMEHGFEILQLLFNIGLAITAKINNAISSTNPEVTFDAAKMIEDFKAEWGFNGMLSFLSTAFLFCFLLLPWLMSWLMGLFVNLICYSRVIEIYVRAVMAPIALSDFYHSGFQSTGWKFLKGFFAIALQGALILVISVIFSLMLQAILITDARNMWTFIGSYLAFYGASCMLMFKSLQLTKELVGAV